MPIRQRAYAKELEKQIAGGKGLTEAGHKKAIKKATMKPKSKVDNEGWVGKLKGKVKTHFAAKKAEKKRLATRKVRLAAKRKQDEAKIAKAKKRGARI